MNYSKRYDGFEKQCDITKDIVNYFLNYWPHDIKSVTAENEIFEKLSCDLKLKVYYTKYKRLI